MKKRKELQTNNELQELCNFVREKVSEGNYASSVEDISIAMQHYPHAPEPHNLMGIVLEKNGDHVSAMKHFRAAWALDPTYLPARYNLETYGTFFTSGKCAFDENDIPSEPSAMHKTAFDNRGVGHL